jgi:hypothetical protein
LSERAGRGSHRCAVEDPSAELQVLIEEQANALARRDDNSLVTIPVYWHVVTTAAGVGNISGRVPDQMQVLNDAYAQYGVVFDVKGVQVVANNAWYFSEAGSAEEVDMKSTLRQGGPETLNIYTTNGDIYLGWATPAFYYKFSPSYDGVVL